MLHKLRRKETPPKIVQLVEPAKTVIPPFGEWLKIVSPAWSWHWRHLVFIREQLDRLTRGEISRLMIFIPPQHGKSEQTTVRYPVWRLERDPTLRVAITAYNQRHANRFSRKARRLAEGRISLSKDRTSVEEWETDQGGSVLALGVGAGIAGNPVDLLLIDDPVRSREDAESEVIREAVWEWYTDDVYTRLQPGAAALLIMCMTGDTPVLMADGTETNLRNVKIGDSIATFDDGRLSTSIITNWKSQGKDNCFEIRTISGRNVKANARHPFLVFRNGVLTWVRLKQLAVGDKIACLKERGRENNAPLKDVESQSVVEDCASLIMVKRVGAAEFAQLLRNAGKEECGIVTELSRKNSTPWSKSKAASALCVENRRAAETREPIGIISSASITTTKPEKFGDCSAMIATSSLAMERRPKSLRPPLSMYAIGLDEIESIVPTGIEEVFDIQVDRTENFIANGLVSHNTRWNTDDLAGRILSSEDGPNWTVIRLPAEAEQDDPMGRALGEALCPERFDLAALANRRLVLGRSYEALYQQNPVPREGAIFKRSTFRYYKPFHGGDGALLDMWPVPWSTCRLFGVADLACSQKKLADYTALFVFADDRRGNLILVDHVRERIEGPDLVKRMKALSAKWDGCYWLVESQGFQLTIAQQGRREGLAMRELTRPKGDDKVSRAMAAAVRFEGRTVWFPMGDSFMPILEEELLTFPAGAHDDMVDVISDACAEMGRLYIQAKGSLPTAVGRIGAPGVRR